MDELKDAVKMFSKDMSDSLTSSTSLSFAEDNWVSFTPRNYPVASMGKLTDWAYNQLAGRLDAPPTRWLLDDTHCDTGLRNGIMDYLVKVRPEQGLTVRMNGDSVRAVLSDQYTKFDHTELVDMVGEAITEMGVQAEVRRAEIGDELRAYVLVPSITFANDPTKQGNGGLHPAVYLSNSERGGGAVRITGAVYRSVCSNGVIYGWSATDVFSMRHRWIDQNGMRVLVADALAQSFKMSEKAAMAFVRAQQLQVEPRSLKPIVNEWALKYGISISAKENWLQVITSEATSYGRAEDPRLFDVVNAATYVAQQQIPAEREQMERMAGDILFYQGGNDDAEA